MITNILLGLILGILISSFIILKRKLNDIDTTNAYCGTIIRTLRSINGVNSNNNKLIEELLTKQNEIMSKDIDRHNKIVTELNWINKQVIFTKRNTDDIKQIINDQHIAKKKSSKQAKFSSKIDSKSKVDIQHQK